MKTYTHSMSDDDSEYANLQSVGAIQMNGGHHHVNHSPPPHHHPQHPHQDYFGISPEDNYVDCKQQFAQLNTYFANEASTINHADINANLHYHHPDPIETASMCNMTESSGNSSGESESYSATDDRNTPLHGTRKVRKHQVPDVLKDEKYWQRRVKNNLAAKKSREARRKKEKQIAVRATFLEKENEMLKGELRKIREENEQLKTMLYN